MDRGFVVLVVGYVLGRLSALAQGRGLKRVDRSRGSWDTRVAARRGRVLKLRCLRYRLAARSPNGTFFQSAGVEIIVAG
jgi:hypothetical protein